MSVILDALKKLDHERSLRRSGAPNIAVDILKPDLPPHRRRIFIFLAAVSIATAAVTYTLIAGFGILSKSSPPPPMSSSAAGRQVSPAPAETASVSKHSLPAPVSQPAPNQSGPAVPSIQESSPPLPAISQPPTQQALPALPESAPLPKSSPPPPMIQTAPAQQESPVSLSREPVRNARDEAGVAGAKTPDSVEGKVPVTPQVEKKTSQQVIREETRAAPEIVEEPDEETMTELPATPSSLKISGIVWSEEPANRVAVINSMPVNEGAFIGGIKVVEIYPTRVRFLYNERSFEIPLGTTAPIK